MKKEIEKIIDKVCKEIEIEPALVKAMVETESAGNPNSETLYARGLMQISKVALKEINDRYGLDYTYDEMFEPEKNSFNPS